MRKLDMARVSETFTEAGWDRTSLSAMQVAVYVMCGGGFLGRFAAEQPADFYIDDRCGRLPYTKTEITQAVEILKVAAEKLGVDPHHMPEMPRFHNMGVF